ncbi:hypothetical protein Bhyg_13258 [Pseudolycoriella hygida]|uniref:Uncharacterized protein n=1 Tax=Pseudolycoriella hygida TaxID=35572 RepID=A0A9Q0MN06_9DIPT|nr:hypothetical protein Bhyg_13258 [Pseudolycoriella hygida]
MPRKRLLTKTTQHVVEISSSDSDSDDSENGLQMRTSTDIINSFLNRGDSRESVSKFRKASDVINWFLGKKNDLNEANSSQGSQLQGALKIINNHLGKDIVGNSEETIESTSNLREEGRVTASTSELSSGPSLRLKRRKISESAKTFSSQSHSDSNLVKRNGKTCRLTVTLHRILPTDTNVVKKPTTRRNKPGNKSASDKIPTSHRRSKQNIQPLVRRTVEDDSSSESDYPLSTLLNTKIKFAVKREIRNKKTRVTRIVETEKVVKGIQIPKEKYDQALEMLNNEECRYDETPVVFSYQPKPNCADIRRNCISRQYAEATYDAAKLGMFLPTSLTRIVLEMENCLRKEDWQQMAELIYFGCDLMKTEQSRRAIGTAFFTYTLLMLILDTSHGPTMDARRQEVMKFLIALGGEPEESEEFMRELNFVLDDRSFVNDLVNKS